MHGMTNHFNAGGGRRRRSARLIILPAIALLCAALSLPGLTAQNGGQDGRQDRIPPIHERMVKLLDEHYERHDTTSTLSGVVERMSSLLLMVDSTEQYHYRGKALDHDGQEYNFGFDMSVMHFTEEHELKFAITALYEIYEINHKQLYTSARTKKSKAPPFILIGAGTTMTLITTDCDAFRVKSDWLDFSELVRTLTIKARTVCVNDCMGPVYLY